MTLPDDLLRIDTPENVAFDYEVAGIGSRFMAALVDTLFIAILQVVVILVLIAVVGGLLPERFKAWLAALLSLVGFAFSWGYYIFFEMIWNGQSPGKRWAGLRVMRTDGTPITLSESIIRNLVRLVDFMPAFYGVGVLTMFINAQARRLGDLVAGTLVVRDRATVTLDGLETRPDGLRPIQQGPAADVELPVERLTRQDLQLAEEFLRRRIELAGRAEMAQRIARVLLQRMGLPAGPMDGHTAEQWIQAVIQAARDRGARHGSA